MNGAVIVTGSSRGIGAAVAEMLCLRSVPVAVNYLAERERAESLVDSIRARGGEAIAIQGDVAREQDVVRMFETASRELGYVAGLVNNAGMTGGLARVEDVSAKTIERVLAVNVAGTILCAREAVRRMSTRRGGAGGSIVNVSSRAAVTGGAGEWVPYAAAKGAVDSFTVGLAREVALEGIRVNCVSPGLILTELHARNGAPDRPERMAPVIPMGRPGTPREVAEAIVWLLSEAASYVTATVLAVGGGR